MTEESRSLGAGGGLQIAGYLGVLKWIALLHSKWLQQV